MIDKNIQRLVRREAAMAKPKIDADTLFTSHEFNEHLRNLIDVVTGRYKVPVQLRLFHDEASPVTACTDGRVIIQNTHNELVYEFENLYNRYMTCAGMTMHEVSHILFCDFKEKERAIDFIKQGVLYGDAPEPQTQEEADQLDEMLNALQIPEYRPVFVEIYSNLSNCIADPHDEDKLIEKFGGFVESTILMCREALRMGIQPMEDMMANDKVSALSLIFSVILQFVRFGEIVANDPDAMYKLEPIQKLMKMSVALEQARYTDSPLVKAEQMNKVLLYLWPYIKEEIDKQIQNEQNQDSTSQQQQRGASQQQPGTGQQQSLSEQIVESILDQLRQGSQNAGQTQAPQNGKSSAEAKKATRAAKKGQQKTNTLGISASQPSQLQQDELGEQVFSSLLNSILQAMAEKSVQQDISNAVGAEISAIDQKSTHRGRTVEIVNQTDVTDEDKRLYDELLKDLCSYSKRLQKQMTDMMKDLKDGSVTHHRAFGNKFEANAAYRPDQRYFAQKKLPQDIPEMAISILVDHSGSMSGKRLQASMKASMLLYDFATNLGIPVCVSGHNTTDTGIRYYTYTDFKKVSNSEKYRLAKMVSGSCNRDGMALEIAAKRLAIRPEEIKLLIIISDGQPNDVDYGGAGAAEDIKEIVQRYQKQGVEVIAAAIGSDKDHIKSIYGEGSFIDIDDLDKFPKMLVKLVKKRLIV